MKKNSIEYSEDQWLLERQKIGDSKVCNSCMQELPLQLYRESKWFKTGLVGTCRDCEKTKTKEYRTNNLEKCKARCNNWRSRNAEKAKKASKLWNGKNKEYFSNWAKENTDKIRNARIKYSKTEKSKNRIKKYKETKKYKERISQYYINNKENILSYSKNWYLKNKERKSASGTLWNQNNPDKRQALQQKFCKNNPEYGKYRTAKRRALLINATPPWADIVDIRKIYKNCPKGYHVDHIIPLNNPIVCGLHVPWNLQYLTASENLKKSNKIPK